MSIFPSESISNFIQSTVTDSTVLPLAKEYAWDFINDDFILVDGKNVIVTGKDAVKVWIWKALQTQKNVYKAYSQSFGNGLETLISQGLSDAALKSEIERYLKESLMVNPYITGISDISIIVEGSKTDVSFTTTTIYGEVRINGV